MPPLSHVKPSRHVNHYSTSPEESLLQLCFWSICPMRWSYGICYPRPHQTSGYLHSRRSFHSLPHIIGTQNIIWHLPHAYQIPRQASDGSRSINNFVNYHILSVSVNDSSVWISDAREHCWSTTRYTRWPSWERADPFQRRRIQCHIFLQSFLDQKLFLLQPQQWI